jgi:ABC-type branched-subunit amino acid transport system substrate-binding protein
VRLDLVDGYGASALKGAKAYFDALNAAGGVNGRRLVLRTLDDDNKNSQASDNKNTQ